MIKSLSRFISTTVVWCLCIIGVVAIMILVQRFWTRGASNDLKPVAVIYSPDHHYKAVVYNESGGGGLAPYCMDTISVAPENISDFKASSGEYEIYGGSCGGLPFGEYQKAIEWITDNKLQITFNPTLGSQGANLTIKGWADSGHVQITYKQ